MGASLHQSSLLARVVAVIVLAYLLLPAFVVFPVSLTPNRYLSLPVEGISWQHWRTLFTDPVWLNGLWESALIAGLSTAIAVAAGTACAIGCWRLGSRLTDIVRSAMILPLMVPTIVYALGIYRLYVELDLIGTMVGVVLAHAVTGLPYVVLTVTASLANLDSSLERAARNLGASVSQTLWRVIIPNILPGILSGAIFAFIHSWDELVIVIFIGGRQLFTLPRLMWDGINENLDPAIAAAASALILFTLAVLLVEGGLRRRRLARAERQT